MRIHPGKFAVVSMAAMVFLFIGCGAEDVVDETKEGTPLTITAASLNSEEPAGVQMRAATTLTSGSIGVYRLAATGYTGTRDNVEYAYSGGNWGVASGVTPVYLTGKAATICAYYPYNASMSSNPTAINLTSQVHSQAADLSYTLGKSLSSGSATTTFELQRAYAKVTITLQHEASYSGNCAVSNVSIANAGVLTSNTLNMTTGVYGSGTAGTVSIDPAIASIASGSSTTATILMVPSTTALSGNLTFLFTIDGVKNTASLTASSLGASSKFEAGKNYGVTGKISGEGTTLQLASVAGSGTSSMMVQPTANSYIITPGSSLTIPVGIKGNGDGYTAGLASITTTHTASTVVKYWETKNGLISVGTLDATAQTVLVTAGATEGNAVIAAKDANGNIIWSWHIWVTDNPATETVNGYIWMDRNLGATEVANGTTYDKCGGLMYQWGRKDPFVGSDGLTTEIATFLPIFNYTGPATSAAYLTALSSAGLSSTAPSTINYGPNYLRLNVTNLTGTYTNQLTASIRFPMLLLISWSGSTATEAAAYTAAGGKSSWGGEYGESKSIFDPCPIGWRVPSGRKTSSTWASPWNTWTYMSIISTPYYAYNAYLWKNTSTNALNAYKYPTAGYLYLCTELSSVGFKGFYWSASSTSSQGYNLGFESDYLDTSDFTVREDGMSVRCVKE